MTMHRAAPSNSSDLPNAPSLSIVGTSNGVLHGGYGAQLAADPFFSRVANFSIGFCSSDLFSLADARNDLTGYDLCLLDLACNDSTLLASGFIDEAYIDASIRHAVSKASENGALPVLLIMPVEDYQAKDGGPIVSVYEKIAREMGVLTFNGYRWTARIKQDGVLGDRDLFRDTMHLHPPVARALARGLVEALRRFAARAIPLSRTLSPCAPRKFIPLFPLPLGGAAMKRRRTSLTGDVDLVDLPEGGWDTAVAEGAELVAVAADFAHCNALLGLNGRNSFRLHLATDMFNADDNALMVGIMPFHRAVASLNGFVRLNAMAQGAADRKTHWNADALMEGKPVGLSLLGFTHKYPERPVEHVRVETDATELCALLDEEAIAAARQEIADAREKEKEKEKAAG